MSAGSIALLVVYILNTLLAIIMIFVEKKQTSTVIAWLSVMVFLPIVGFVFYILMGSGLGLRTRLMLKKTNMANVINKRELDELIKNYNYNFDDTTGDLLVRHKSLIEFNYNWAGSILTDKNKIQFFNNGLDKFNALKNDIINAKNHIHLDYYIFANDTIGLEILNLCIEKLKQGVKVKILIDSVGSIKTRKRHFKNFEKAGGEFKEFFPPIIPLKLFNLKMNYRNHRKIAVIDGKIGYVGGINLRLDHMGFDRRLKPWRDAHIRIEGVGVYDLQATFLSDWRFATYDYKYPIKYLMPDYFPEIKSDGDCPMQVITSGPSNNKCEIKNALIKMINGAKKRIKIQTPYFVPDEVYFDSIKLAKASGVDVEIMVPEIPDKHFVYNASLSYLRDLVNLGVKVFTYRGFLHSKTMVVDDEICTIGTCNSDIRSFKLNFEINAIIYNKSFTQTIVDGYNNDKLNCDEFNLEKINKLSLLKRFNMSLCRMFTPLL